jgi:nucleotide-binding universal stress UspA family protein
MTKHILVAYDFSAPSNRALELAHHLRARLRAAVDVVHVFVDPFAELEHPPKESIWATPEQMEAHLEAMRGQVRAAVEDVFGPDLHAVTVHAVRGQPAVELLRLADKVGADLIVVGATGKGGVERALLGSVSTHLIRKSPVAVLTVK